MASLCLWCDKPLTGRTSRARFCSGTNCQLSYYRADKRMQVDEFLEKIAYTPPPESGLGLAASIATPDHRGNTEAQRLNWALRTSPIIVESFGRSSLIASATPMSMGVNRWDYASKLANVNGDKQPVAGDPNYRKLLGPMPAGWKPVQPRVDSATITLQAYMQERVHPHPKPAVVASAAGTPYHGPDVACGVCGAARRTASTGNGTLQRSAAAPHNPRK